VESARVLGLGVGGQSGLLEGITRCFVESVIVLLSSDFAHPLFMVFILQVLFDLFCNLHHSLDISQHTRDTLRLLLIETIHFLRNAIEILIIDFLN
jgi:hypothetical protein